MSVGEPETQEGWVAAEVANEFPQLRISSCEVSVRPVRRSPKPIKERLRELAGRAYGAQALELRRQPIPAAYRVFFHHIGLDPDATRTPVEEAMLERLFHGGFPSRNLVDDVLLISLVETGVPVWALDAARVSGPLGIRLAGAGETLGEDADATALAPGRLVVADASSPLAVLFGELAPGHGVTFATRCATLFSVAVAGVPAIHVEEALWISASLLGEG